VGLRLLGSEEPRNPVTARPMMTPDRLRFMAGVMAVLFLGLLVYLLGGLVQTLAPAMTRS